MMLPSILSLFLLIGLVSSQGLVNKTIVEWSRQFRTCDPVGDVEIPRTGTTRMVYSYNDQQNNLPPTDDRSPQPHGPNRRGQMNINFFDAASNFNTTDPDKYDVVLMTRPYIIPQIDTYYHCQAFHTNWGQKKLHIIQAEPRINYDHRDVIHHVLLMTCTVPIPAADLAYSGPCYETRTPKGDFPGMPRSLQMCDQVSLLAGWAVGAGPVILPEEAGFPVQGGKYYLMQIHYNNPKLLALNDSTGFALTVTPNLRQYDAACLEFVRPLQSIEIPSGNSSFVVESYADQQLFNTAVRVGGMQNPIKIFGAFLHSHLLGRQIRVSQFRAGMYINDIDFNPGYDFNFQMTVMFETPRLLYSTDTLKLQCFYDSTGRTETTYGGTATTDEMCQAYLYYYPATANPVTMAGAYPADPVPPYNMRTDGVYPTFFEFGMLQDANGTSAGTKHLVTPPTIVPQCTTTYSVPYSSGTRGTTYLPISSFNPKKYSNSLIMDALGKYKLYWNVSMFEDGNNGIISFAAEVETGGWLGLGISPTGNMIGSDVIMAWVNSDTQTVSILDRKATQHAQPEIDSSQDIFDLKGYKGLYPKTTPDKNPLYYYP